MIQDKLTQARAELNYLKTTGTHHLIDETLAIFRIISPDVLNQSHKDLIEDMLEEELQLTVMRLEDAIKDKIVELELLCSK